MTSIFQTVLGADFDRLHPRLRRRFSVGLATGEACLGTGTMDEVWHTRWAAPFLRLGSTRNILVPGAGRDVPFTIENVPYLDDFGRETVSFVRTFAFPGGARRFDAQMVLAAGGGHIVDYLGTHQHLASDLHLEVDGDGLVIRSGAHRFREGRLDVRLPRPIAAEAEVREDYDDAIGRFRIRVRVTHPWFGPLFGYQGTFTATYADHLSPRPGLRPVREECRM